MTSGPAPRQAPLALGADAFRTLGHALVEQLARLLESVPDRPVTRDEAPVLRHQERLRRMRHKEAREDDEPVVSAPAGQPQ